MGLILIGWILNWVDFDRVDFDWVDFDRVDFECVPLLEWIVFLSKKIAT